MVSLPKISKKSRSDERASEIGVAVEHHPVIPSRIFRLGGLSCMIDALLLNLFPRW